MNLADIQAMHPRLLIPRDDIELGNRLFALYGAEAWLDVMPDLEAEAAKAPAGRGRIFLSAVTAAMAAKGWVLEPEDYRRAGLPIPKGVAHGA